ncbi:uncharacterized protein LOC134469917 [Engraulis encrasicolus]|uniref:uncharacterized protein LOC134469917 n=1 Tax=Engraulis encrasicolus TaxID=184585 RepID=UPI002FD56BF6
MGATDDVEAYLYAFEATATREGWPKAQWVGLLAPFLTGEALNSVRDLPPDKITDYDALKLEIFSRHGLTKFGMAQRFHGWTFQVDQAPRAQMHELSRIARKWLEPEKNTAAAVVETIVVDHFLRALPYEAKRFISQQALTTAAVTIEAVEKYQATTEMLRATKRDPRTTTPQPTVGVRPKTTKGTSPSAAAPSYAPLGARRQSGLVRMSRDSETRECYRCGEIGHMSCQCQKILDEPMPTAGSSSSPSTQLFASLVGVADGPPDRPPTCPVTVNCHDVEALLDSGSRVTLVHKDLVDPSCLSTDKVLPISCVHGDTKDYPTTELKVTTTRGIIHTRAGVVESLPVPVLIGRDCPSFDLLFRETQQRPARVPRSRRGMTGPQADTDSGPDTEEENAAPESSPNSEEDAPAIEELPNLTGQYGTAQLQEPTFANALRNVQVLEGRERE